MSGFRKLAELGFKRSADKCKEKFEEESGRHLNNINYNKGTTTTPSYMVFSQFQELYEPNQEAVHEGGEGGEEDSRKDELVDERINPCDNDEQLVIVDKSKKRKRQKKKKNKDKNEKFEMFKSLCEDVVNKLMTQQEAIQNKLIEEMVKRDEEEIAREEALKKQELDRFHKELEFRAHEQVIASDRQATLINYLKTFTSSSTSSTSTTKTTLRCDLVNYYKLQNPNPNPNPNPITTPTSLANDLTPQNPNSSSTNKTSRLSCSHDYKEDIGKRWPREEVLALINLRCNLCDTNHRHHQGNINGGGGEEGGELLKAPLWERISQGMLDLGYKRSAKRCKEKWENINKYFRKTKDINKKRSLESRTCPYFEQLNTLYTQGTLVPPPIASPENPRVDSSQNGSMDGEKNMVQGVSPPAAAASFEFEF